jgi:hypothetical protein
MRLQFSHDTPSTDIRLRAVWLCNATFGDRHSGSPLGHWVCHQAVDLALEAPRPSPRGLGTFPHGQCGSSGRPHAAKNQAGYSQSSDEGVGGVGPVRRRLATRQPGTDAGVAIERQLRLTRGRRPNPVTVSAHALVGAPERSAYGISKAALLQMTLRLTNSVWTEPIYPLDSLSGLLPGPSQRWG